MKLSSIMKNSRRTIFFVYLVGIIFSAFHADVSAQGKKLTQPATVKSSKKIVPPIAPLIAEDRIRGNEVERASDFISNFSSNAGKPERSQFETQDVYDTKINKWDKKAITYLRVDRSDSYFKYDIENKILTFRIGGFLHSPEKSLSGIPISVALNEVRDASQATNGFGANLTVNETHKKQFLIYATNSDVGTYVLPYTTSGYLGGEIDMRVTLPPKEAEQLSTEYEFIVGIEPTGHNQSYQESRYIKSATFQSPSETSVSTFALEAKITYLAIRNSRTKNILVDVDCR